MTKQKFTVPVVRIGYGFTNIEVEATNQEEAEQLALDEAGDHEYSEKSSEYEVEGTSAAEKATTLKMAETLRGVLRDLESIDEEELTTFEKNLLADCREIFQKP
jgi:hypothetical protein